MKTTDEYAADPGHCPKCGSTQMEGEHVVIDEGRALQEVSCLGCGSSWTDVYQLSSYEGFAERES